MSNQIKFLMPPPGLFQPTNVHDPLLFYYKPVVGTLYRQRIQAGLDLLEGRQYGKVLEFGYGSGLLLPSLSQISESLYAVDLEADPGMVRKALDRAGVTAHLFRGDICQLRFPDGEFDLIVAFSVFEHISDPRMILERMAVLLRPGGTLLVGMPKVSQGMDRLFKWIGYNDIEKNHVKDHQGFLKDVGPWFNLIKISHLPTFFPAQAALYFNMLFRKKEN